MKRPNRLVTAMAAIALGTLPTSISAQSTPVMPQSMPMRSVGQPQDGITVTAIGSASGQATTMQFTLYVGTRGNTNTMTAAALEPIIGALVASGVDRSSIQLPMNFQAPGARANNAMITGTVSHPTQAMLTQALTNVTAAVNAQSIVYVGNAQVFLRIDDCSAITDASRTDAIRRARARAEATARDLGVKLGAVQSAAVNTSLEANGSCQTSYNVPGYPAPQGADAFTVQVMTPVTLRFAIR